MAKFMVGSNMVNIAFMHLCTKAINVFELRLEYLLIWLMIELTDQSYIVLS